MQLRVVPYHGLFHLRRLAVDVKATHPGATVEITKTFSEDPFSVAFHPSGLHLLVGFADKLRLMNLLRFIQPHSDSFPPRFTQSHPDPPSLTQICYVSLRSILIHSDFLKFIQVKPRFAQTHLDYIDKS